jgi:hypothetical protein
MKYQATTAWYFVASSKASQKATELVRFASKLCKGPDPWEYLGGGSYAKMGHLMRIKGKEVGMKS